MSTPTINRDNAPTQAPSRPQAQAPNRASQAAQARQQEKPEQTRAQQAQEGKQKEAPASAPAPEQKKPAEAPQKPADQVTRSAEADDRGPQGVVSRERSEQLSGLSDNLARPAETPTKKSEANWNAMGGIGEPEILYTTAPPPANGDTNTNAQPSTTTVKIEAWGQGEGQNDSVWNALKNQGYTDQQITDQGLVDEVAKTNQLDDPNVVQPGQELQIPTLAPPPATEPPKPGETPAPKPGERTAQELDQNSDPEALKQREYAQTFNQNFADFDAAADQDHKADGKVSQLDLQAIANGTVYADEKTRAAAQYYMQNPDAMRNLDQAGASDQDKAKGDNVIAKTDAEANLEAANQRVRDTGRTEEQRKEYDANKNRVNDNALQTLEQNFGSLAGPDGNFTTDDLNKLAKDPSADPQMREAAQFMIDNPNRLKGADASSDPTKKSDGTFTMGDILGGRIDTFNELRKNPDAQRAQEVQQQQTTKWDTPQAALENLAQNPDLSTYSDAQLASLALLAQSDPQARSQIAQATGGYINDRTNSLDDIPGNPGFQVLLSQQVVSPQSLDGLSPEARKAVEAAQGTLKNEVNRNLGETLSGNLKGKKGDDQVDEALKNFQTQLGESAKTNPALAPLYKEGLEGLGKNEGVGDILRQARQADDGPLGQLTDAIGSGLSTAFEWTGDTLGDLAEFGFRNTGAGLPLTLATEGLAMAGFDAPKKYYDQFTDGAFDRPLESLVGGLGTTLGNGWKNPTESLTGLYSLTNLKPAVDLLSGKPFGEVLQERGQVAENVWDAVSSDYRQTFQQDGVVGGLSHIGSDILTTVATAGLGKAPAAIDAAGDAARAGSTLGRLAELGKLGQLPLEGLGDLTGTALAKAGVPEWASELAGKAVGNTQGSVIENAPEVPADQASPQWFNDFATSAANGFGVPDKLAEFFRGLGVG